MDKKIWSHYIGNIKKLQIKNKGSSDLYNNIKSEIKVSQCKNQNNLSQKAFTDTQEMLPKHNNVEQASDPEKTLRKYRTLGLDKNTQTKIDRGNYKIDIVLDLHMRSRVQGQLLLEETILYAFQSNMRMLLLITGKGSVEKPSILRELVPHWLATPPINRYVVYHKIAKKEHGGSGAFYIFLKKN